MTKTKKRPIIEEGQTLYISYKEIFKEPTPNLKEYTVVKVNSTSIYAKAKDSKSEIRLDRRTLTSKQGSSALYHYTAYLAEEEYWDTVQVAKEKETLQHNIGKSLKNLDVDTLRLIQDLITTKK